MLDSLTLLRAMNGIHEEDVIMAGRILMKQQHSKGRPAKRLVTLALAAALLLALGAAAYALSAHGAFFHAVFGTGIKGREAQDLVLSDGSDGGIPKTEHYPASERVEVDEEQAEALTGGYVTALGQSAEAGGYTFTIREAVLDENGIGAVTVHIENPEGHRLKESGIYDGTKGEKQPLSAWLYVAGDETNFLDNREYLIPESFTETEADYVYYITPFRPLPAGTDLSFRFKVNDEPKPFPSWPTAVLTLPAQERLPARTMSGEGVRASLSPLGIALYAEREFMEESLVLRYADGSEYTVMGDDTANITLGSRGLDGRTSYYCFNRLAVPENVTEIVLTGHYPVGEAFEPVELILK